MNNCPFYYSFDPSGIFTESFQFTESEIFSKTNEFSKSNEFSKTNEFSKSNEFVFEEPIHSFIDSLEYNDTFFDESFSLSETKPSENVINKDSSGKKSKSKNLEKTILLCCITCFEVILIVLVIVIIIVVVKINRNHELIEPLIDDSD